MSRPAASQSIPNDRSAGQPLRWQFGGALTASLVDSAGNSVATVDGRGDGHPIRISLGQASATLDVPGEGEFPPLDEKFVRGDELHLMYPQMDQRFAVRLAIEPLTPPANVDAQDFGDGLVVLECRVSVQTDLLDTHPTIDLRTDRDTPLTPLLNEADRRGSTRVDDDTVRLFGDFLEKGVIRRGQPWLVNLPASDEDRLATLSRWQADRKTVLSD